jgi:hypothetical protein
MQVDLLLTSQQEQVNWNKIFKKENMIADLMFSWWLYVNAKSVYHAGGVDPKFHSFMRDIWK